MAKKRRKQHRSRAQAPRAGATRTAERPRTGTTGDSTDEATPPTSRATRTANVPARAPAGPQRSRAEKKELARKEREAVRRRIARERRARQLVWVAGLAAVVAVGAFFLLKPDEAAEPTGSLPGELTTEAPWPANGAKAPERANRLGLPAEGTTMHEHADVQIFVHGNQEPVPVNIGIDVTGGRITSIHTHDDTGVVHLESSQARQFTLGEFMGVWGVRFTPSCIGAYCAGNGSRLRVFVDGQPFGGDPRDVPLDDLSVIVVTFGTQGELPNPIPSSFDFSTIQP